MNLVLFTNRYGESSVLTRLIAALLMPTLMLTCPAILNAADTAAQTRADKLVHPDPVVSPTHVSVNHKLPSVTAPTGTFSLPAHPSDQDIFNNSLFEEPLVPIGAKTTKAENSALAQSLTTFSKREVRDDYGALESYLAANPQSPWRISLLTDLGWSYRQTGWYSKALGAWSEAWTEGQSVTDPVGKIVVDRSLAELIVLNARVGRMDVIRTLISAADKRNLSGSSKEKVEAAKQALQLMKTNPAVAFRCGPMAVEKIRNIKDNNKLSELKSMSLGSTEQGTSMGQLNKLAGKLGMAYQVAKRSPGAEVLLPAVVNWKVGHFAALIEAKGNLWRLHDPTFGNDVWVSTNALDEESSGYFLVRTGSLPSGWKAVSDREAATVWGKGAAMVGDSNDNAGPTPNVGCPGTGGGSESPGSPEGSSQASPSSLSPADKFHFGGVTVDGVIGMARYAIYEMLASLSIQDTPLFYKPAYGPSVQFTVSYSQRESNQPSTFTYSNLGPLWTFNWLSYLTDDPTNPGGNVTHYLSNGGTLTYTGYSSTTQTYAPQEQTGCVLKILTSSSYELDEPDGSKQFFSAATTATPRKIFMTQTVDPQGNGLTFSYDSNYRLVAVTDAMGQVTTLSYALSTDIYKITSVTDPFGRSTSLTYTAPTSGSLQSSTDTIGITSTYGYTAGNLTTLTTPYGTTTFSVGQNDNDRWVQVTDPQGGQERVETWPGTNLAIPASVSPAPSGVDNSLLNNRSTFYWDKKAMLTAPGNYNQAQITQWCHEPGINVMSDQVSSIKKPLESRVYYNYPGQGWDIVVGTSGQPSRVVRILDDGSTQQTQATYNAMNKLTQSTDALGRVTNYVYAANNIDLIQVNQQNGSNNDILASTTYNSLHEPLTTTDAAGQTTAYTYYPDGQIHTITDAKSETTTFAYSGGSSGYLTSITGAQAGDTTGITYDGYGRIATITDVNGYTLTYGYDNLNRQTEVTYPDGTYEENVYTNLDRTQSRDRQGRWTRSFYNPVEQVTAVIDSADRVTNYTRCICGELTAIIDPLLHKTSWTQDIEGRTVTKTFPDGTQLNYGYENSTSRLKTMTDAKGQVTTYSYNEDNTLALISYANVTVATPTVNFTYDPVYTRLIGMTDGSGATSYTYNPITSTPTLGAGRLATETGPLGGTAEITYSYDQLGRTTATAINSVSSGLTYDSLGRITNASNALGSFNYGYYGVTPRLQTLTYQNGQSTSYSYGSASQDFRLSEIKNLTPTGSVLSQNDYTYNEVGTIATWQQQTDNNTPTIWNYNYDRADQLLSAVKNNTSTNAVLSQYFYGYDLGSNRTTEQIGLSVVKTVPNSLNQIATTSAGGPLQFTGSLNKPGSVTVGGNSAAVDANNNFSGTTTVSTGTNSVAVVATNLNGNSATNNYKVIVPPNTGTTPTYDLDGNLVNNGNGQTYAWDAKNELTQISYSGGATSSFTYDGRGRRVSVIEKNSAGTVTSTKQFVWLGNAMAEERDANDNVTKRFFAQGEQIGGTNYYYTRDHLGSIRELTDNTGAIQSRYDYDPYGRPMLIQGANLADFQYASYYAHQTSGLNLTKYRVYDPNTAKWLSRDRIGELGGVNLYGYVGNSSISKSDPLGLCCETETTALHQATANVELAILNSIAAGAQLLLAGTLLALATFNLARVYAATPALVAASPWGWQLAAGQIAAALTAVYAANLYFNYAVAQKLTAEEELAAAEAAEAAAASIYTQCEISCFLSTL